MNDELATCLHDAMCGVLLNKAGCPRYARGSGDPHYDFYQARAVALTSALEPIIGIANVLPVVRIVTDEMA